MSLTTPPTWSDITWTEEQRAYLAAQPGMTRTYVDSVADSALTECKKALAALLAAIIWLLDGQAKTLASETPSSS